MKRKGGKYTYIPKDEIAEVRTFNDVSFEGDDLLDGAYVRGRKKFKHGGVAHDRPMSLEEQAAESVGYDTWYAMDAVDQKELVDELLVSGMIDPMLAMESQLASIDFIRNYYKKPFSDGGMMAYPEYLPAGVSQRELNKKIKDWYIKNYPTDDLGQEIDDTITFKSFWAYSGQGYTPYESLGVADSVVRERVEEKLSAIFGMMAKGREIEEGDFVFVKPEKLYAEVVRVTGENVVVEFTDRRPSGGDKRGNYKIKDLTKKNPSYADGGQMVVLQKAMKGYADGGMIYLISDDGYEVNISQTDLSKETRSFFKKSMTQQEIKELGTSKYNSFIHYLDKKGYKKYADGGKTASKKEIKLTYHKTTGGAEYLMSNKDGDFSESKYIVRIDKAKMLGGELLIISRLFLAMSIKKQNLYYHKTSGGAEYLTSKEHDLDSEYVVRIDGASWSAWSPLIIKSKSKKMADGGVTDDLVKQSAIEEALKIATIAYQNDITASGNSLEKFSNKIFEASGLSFAKPYLALAYQSMRNQGYADGGEISYVVKYSMKDTPEVVKEKIFADKDAAELFHETISDDEDLVVMDLEVLKPKPVVAPQPQPAKKSSLFASAKPVPATASARKKQREQVQVNGIADEIARYDELKAAINNAKAEQEVIGGRLKELGREKFLDLYEQRGVRPANFDLADGDQNILLEVTDKYLKVEPEKAELLRQYDGLLEEKTTYEFDSEILEKEVSDGMTIGDVVSMLIQESKLIPDSDKANLIKAKMSMRVPKGTIDRLMQYDNPREVFSLISPILALK